MEFCRLCQRDIGKRSHPKENLRDLVKKGFDLDMDSDCCCFPLRICDNCRRDLHKFRKHRQHKKTAFKFAIKLETIQHTQSCRDQTSKETSAVSPAVRFQQAASVSAKENNFILLEEDQDSLLYARITREANSNIQVQIELDGTWKASVRGLLIPPPSPIVQCIPPILTPETVHTLFHGLRHAFPCKGNSDFESVCRARFPNSPAVFFDRDGIRSATEEMHNNEPIIRSVSCHLLSTTNQCQECRDHRPILRAIAHREKNKYASNPSTSTRNDYLSKDHLNTKIHLLKQQNHQLRRNITKLQDQILKETEEEGVNLSEMQHGEFAEIMTEQNKVAEAASEEDSPQQLLWKQHMSNAKKAYSTQNRWHPLILKWCIALHHKSSSAYDFIRSSGMVSLPHRSTLRRYTNFTTPQTGFNPDIIQEVVRQSNINNLSPEQDFKRNVTILFDEMKVKRGLVYSKKTGSLVGYVDLGDINNDLLEFQKRVENDGKEESPNIATHVLAIMVRGMFCPLHKSIAYFATTSITSDQLYPILWDAVEVLETVGFKVRAFVSDGASPNRKFYKLHSQDNHRLTYCTPNNRSYDSRDIYFICDAPHLLKTTRNNWENSGWHNKTRNLKYNKQDIKWTHLVNLVEQGHVSKNSPGYHQLHKITADHIYLNPSLRMRVKLAAQVLSSTVAAALEQEGRFETKSTIKFVKYMDQFFDCMNVQRPTDGQYTRKPMLRPYTSPDDPRFEWLLKDFLGFLDEWESESMNAPDLTKTEQRRLCLSEPTLDGLRITVFAFVSLAKEVLQEPGVKFLLSDKGNQDALEEEFSKIRGSGGKWDQPTVERYGDLALNVLVGGDCVSGSMKANCKHQSATFEMDTTLPKPHKRAKKLTYRQHSQPRM